MSLDDRSLREHLDRRATSGLIDPADLAESVMAGLPATTPAPLWRRFAQRSRSLGLAAAAVVVVVLVGSALLPRINLGPASSALPTATAPVSAYPASRPLTLDELNWYLGPGPHLRAGAVVVADVEISPKPLECDDCPDLMVLFPDRRVTVLTGDDADVGGPYAFRVSSDGDLELLAAVTASAGGLAWTLPDYLARLPDFLAADRLGPQAYVVEATGGHMPPPSCPTASESTGSTFDVGCGPAAWLRPLGGEFPTALDGEFETPADGLRIQNGAPDGSTEGVGVDGFFLVRPLGVDLCFMCVQGQTSQYLATLTPIQLPKPAPSATTSDAAYPAARSLDLADLDAILGPDPALLSGVDVVADVTLALRGLICDSAFCPDMEVELPSRTIKVYNWDGPLGDGPYALRVRDDGSLELLGAVRPGPDGLAWTLPQLLEVIEDVRANDRAVPYLYLVDAVRRVETEAVYCDAPGDDVGDPLFGCGRGLAWLVKAEDVERPVGSAAPPDSLRIPNVNAGRLVAGEHGFWLVDPLRDAGQALCLLCPPAGGADLIGRIRPVDALDIPEPSPTATRSAARIDLNHLDFSTSSVTLHGFDTADVGVQVGLTGEVIATAQVDGSITPLICIEKSDDDPDDGHAAVRIGRLFRIPGTDQWTATFRMTSGDRGRWTVSCLRANDADGNLLDVDPLDTGGLSVLEVIGFNPPAITMAFEPSPAEIGQPLVILGRVTDEDTGQALGGVTVTIGIDTVCTQGGPGEMLVTDADGDYTFEIPVADGFEVCAGIFDPAGTFPGGEARDPVGVYAMRSARSVDL